MSRSIDFFKKFFINYFWLGIVFVLIAIIIDSYLCKSSGCAKMLEIFVKTLESVGIAILIAAIFTFASGTSDFVDKIKGLLEDIIIKRNFLGNIDPEGKKEALKSLVQPSLSEKSKYPNIGDYYGYFINKTLEINKKSVRSNYQINCRAYFDPGINKIAVDCTYSYRVYPSCDGFHEIVIGFNEELDGPSICKQVAISIPEGERDVIDELNFIKEDEGGDISKTATVSTKKYDGSTHLDVELKVVEYGSDHWQLITFKALQPTDGFKFILHCDDQILIQQHSIFVVGAKYFVDESPSKKDFTVNCNQWINEGSGLSVLIAIPHVSNAGVIS